MVLLCRIFVVLDSLLVIKHSLVSSTSRWGNARLALKRWWLICRNTVTQKQKYFIWRVIVTLSKTEFYFLVKIILIVISEDGDK